MKKRLAFFSIVFLLMYCLAFSSSPQVEKSVEGIWLGTLKVQGMELRIVFNIKPGDKGGLKGTMDSPDQGAKDIDLDIVLFDNNKLVIEIKKAMIKYEAELSEDGKELTGTFRQGGYNFPLNMECIKEAPKIIRPQEPKKPYPYLEEEVSLENQSANVKLAGTLTLPEQGGPFPAVVLITGSGAQDRNEEVFGHRPFLILADHLTRNGIAVLRMDDRGVDGSTGDIDESTSEDFARDILTGVAYLKNRKGIDPKKIGLVGHSEGGLIAPIAASQSEDVAFIVMMAGPGLSGEEILYLQSRQIAQASGVPEEDIEKNMKTQGKIYSLLKSGKPDEVTKEKLHTMFLEDYNRMTEEEKKKIGDPEESFELQVKRVTSKWFRFFLGYDPALTLRKLRCPVLAIIGEKDLQVSAKENLAAIEKALKEGGNGHFTVKELPGLNHLFQKAQTGSPSEYSKITETINPAALNLISGWILKII